MDRDRSYTVEYEYEDMDMEDTEWQDDDGIHHLNWNNFSKDPNLREVQKRMAWFYGCAPDERKLNVSPVVNQYERIGSVYMTLYGSPPKSHAIWLKDARRIYFFGPHLRKYAVWKNADLMGLNK